jgi:glycosyltransferase involved in cell wall biosynthesis
MAEPLRVSVVIPALDEAATIGGLVAEMRRCGPEITEVIVVDDGSSDATAAEAEAAGAVVLRHHERRGYGAALKTGIGAATGTHVLTMDGDGQHRAADVPALLAAAREHDLVSGHRIRVLHTAAWRVPGKWLLRVLAGYLVRRRVPDLNCGFRVFRRDALLRHLRLCPDGYSFSTTTLLLMLHHGDRVAFVPVDVRPAASQGRVTVRTGLDTLILIIRLVTLLDPLRVFLPLSFALVVAGLVWGAPYALAGRGVSVGALLLLLTGVLLFGVGLVSDQIAQLRKEWSSR